VKLGMVPMLHTGFERMRFDPAGPTSAAMSR